MAAKRKAKPKSKPEKPAKATDDGSERDERGRFRKGWRGGPGRKTAQREAAFLVELRRALPPENVGNIVDQLRELAMDGNIQAARQLFQHLLPDPANREHAERELRN